MGAMQNKVLSELKKITEEAGCEFLQEPDWANNGDVRIQKGWKNLLGFYYMFDSGGGAFGSKMTFQFYPGDKQVRRTCGFTDESCIRHDYITYEDTDGIQEMLSWVKQYLSRAR